MYLKRVEISRPVPGPGEQTYQADLCLVMTEGESSPERLIYLACRTRSEGDGTLADRLFRDALRQMRWMPEYRLGTLDLDRSPEIVMAGPQAA